jgi:hypothetical protein
MARRRPFKGFKDLTFLNFGKNFEYGRSAAAFTSAGGWSPMPSKLLGRVKKAVEQLHLSELPASQREALEVNVRLAVSVVDLATEHQKVFPAQRMELKDRAKKLRLAVNILNEEREQFHRLRDHYRIGAKAHGKPITTKSFITDAIAEAEQLADLYEQSVACVSDRRGRAQHLAVLHAWYLQMDVREFFWANECGDTKGRAYWRPWRINRLPGLEPEGLWHKLAGDSYGDKVNYEYLQNLHEPLRAGGHSKQAFWEKKKNSGTKPQN